MLPLRPVLMLVAAALWLPAALAAGIPPFGGASAVAPADDDEKRVWGQGEEFDQMLRKSGRVLNDPELTAYVQQVMDRVFPDFQGRLKVSIIRSPQLNAFALPNGSIYVNQGLLARFQNESQLATVLAHEGIHFVNRHGHQQMQNLKNTTAFSTLLAAVGIPAVGLVANVLAASSIFGYSRELESEADNQGYPRVIAAGYDPRETPKIFSLLIAELKASDIKEPFFFSSHPKLQERYDNFLHLSEKTPPPENMPPDQYLAKFASLRVVNIESELSMGRYKQVLLILGDAEQLKNYPPYANYYLGEAYRQRNAKGDNELLEQAYRKAIEAAPEYAQSYRALGLYFLKTGAYEDAEKQFEKYLTLTQNPADRRYVETYIELARKKGQN